MKTNPDAAVEGVDELFHDGCEVMFRKVAPKRPIISETLKKYLKKAREDRIAPYHHLMLDLLLDQDLAKENNIAHGLAELRGSITIAGGRLKKSDVVRQLREKSAHARNCLVKISDFAEKARDGSGAHKAFHECIVQPCRSLLGMQHDDPRKVGDIDEETGHMIDVIGYCYANCSQDELLKLVSQLIESKGLLYISRLWLLIRRLEGRPFPDAKFGKDSDLEALWTKAWGEPYVEAFANIWSEM